VSCLVRSNTEAKQRPTRKLLQNCQKDIKIWSKTFLSALHRKPVVETSNYKMNQMQQRCNDWHNYDLIPTENISLSESQHVGRHPTRCPRRPCAAVKLYCYWGKLTSLNYEIHHSTRQEWNRSSMWFFRTLSGHHFELWFKTQENVHGATRLAVSKYFSNQ